MFEFPKPGPEHERLRALTGVWDSQVKFYSQPGTPPEESNGEYAAELDLGGYFLARDFAFGGQAFVGRGLTGFDPYKRKYVGVWVDSGSPAVYHTEGAFDASGRVYTETSEGPDPHGKPLKMRMTTEVTDRDHLLFKMYRVGDDGTQTLITEIIHTRRK
jgi:Protein of unknown function (DUF1579)